MNYFTEHSWFYPSTDAVVSIVSLMINSCASCIKPFQYNHGRDESRANLKSHLPSFSSAQDWFAEPNMMRVNVWRNFYDWSTMHSQLFSSTLDRISHGQDRVWITRGDPQQTHNSTDNVSLRSFGNWHFFLLEICRTWDISIQWANKQLVTKHQARQLKLL